MFATMKSMVKVMPYPIFLRAFYAWNQIKMQPRAEAARKRAGIPLLGEIDLSEHKSSDTLFVLGSGPSINRISAARWQEIGRHDTIGFNWWPYHPFVPTFYFLESIEKAESPSAFDAYLQLVNRRASAYASTIKVAMEFHHRGEQTLNFLPDAFKAALFTAHKTEAPARNENELSKALCYLRLRGDFQVTGRFSSLLKYAATLTTVLIFGLKLGYKRIVLCGIDLKTPDYFFQDRAHYSDSWEPPVEARTAAHFTETSLRWKVPVTRAVAVIKRDVLEPAGVQLFLENQESALYPLLPTFALEGGTVPFTPLVPLQNVRVAQG